ncbi:MAG: hypothetical protein U0610_31690 [bacterium]
MSTDGKAETMTTRRAQGFSWSWAMALAVVLAAAAGCGGSSSDGGSAPSIGDVTGTWHEEPGGLSCSFAELGNVPTSADFGDFDFDVVSVGGGALLIDGLTGQAQAAGSNLEAVTSTQFGTGFPCVDGSELLARFTNRYVFRSDAATGYVNHQWIAACASGNGSCSREINDDIHKLE